MHVKKNGCVAHADNDFSGVGFRSGRIGVAAMRKRDACPKLAVAVAVLAVGVDGVRQNLRWNIAPRQLLSDL